MRSRADLSLASIVLLALAASCSSERSYALVNVRAMEGEFADVSQLVVYVSNGDNRDILYYPKTPIGSYSFSTSEVLDFSVSFKTSYKGLLKIGVEPHSAGGGSLGYGEASRPIDPGHVVKMDVFVIRNALPPETGDGGAGDGGGTPPTDGGAPVSMCEPTAAATCGAGKTCYVDCRPGGVGVGMCTASGSKKQGEACTKNEECEPGSQCFQFPCAGDPKPRICMHFCKSDNDCNGGRCSREVPCEDKQTGFRVCTQSCDPRGTGVVGCAAGLTCFIFKGEVTSCDCRSSKRVGADGEACTDTEDCQPGLLCVGMGGSRLCRPICRLGSNQDCSGRTCTKLVDPDYSTWGACVP
jgi:hypothetical protein